MNKRRVLNLIPVLLICLSLALSVTNHDIFPHSYEFSVLLCCISMIIFIINAFIYRKKPSFSPVFGFNDSKNAKNTSLMRFHDVAANECALNSLKELVDFLKFPGKYASVGARIPRGVLLYGPPGTGKTLLARALAGEAQVPFIAMNGSDFVEMYVGVGASRIREIFKKARKLGKCVIFIDEIDTLGRTRGTNASEERDQTLNALLSEMSGFTPSDGVIVVAATNRMEIMDPALLRAGRFDRRIEVGMPGRNERESILKLHARNKPLSKDVNLQSLAASTAFFSGASLENLMNEAAIRAARRGSEAIENTDIESAFITVTAGEDLSSNISDIDKTRIALHEAGHALALKALTPESEIKRISILPSSSGAAGYNLTLPEEKTLHTRKDLMNRLTVLLSGRAAEQIIFGENGITTGASNDLKRAAETAVYMVNEIGMGLSPAVCESSVSKAFGGNREAGEKTREILDEIYVKAMNLMKINIDALTDLTKELMENEVMNGYDIDLFFNHHALSMSIASEETGE